MWRCGSGHSTASALHPVLHGARRSREGSPVVLRSAPTHFPPGAAGPAAPGQYSGGGELVTVPRTAPPTTRTQSVPLSEVADNDTDPVQGVVAGVAGARALQSVGRRDQAERRTVPPDPGPDVPGRRGVVARQGPVREDEPGRVQGHRRVDPAGQLVGVGLRQVEHLFEGHRASRRGRHRGRGLGRGPGPDRETDAGTGDETDHDRGTPERPQDGPVGASDPAQQHPGPVEDPPTAGLEARPASAVATAPRASGRRRCRCLRGSCMVHVAVRHRSRCTVTSIVGSICRRSSRELRDGAVSETDGARIAATDGVAPGTAGAAAGTADAAARTDGTASGTVRSASGDPAPTRRPRRDPVAGPAAVAGRFRASRSRSASAMRARAASAGDDPAPHAMRSRRARAAASSSVRLIRAPRRHARPHAATAAATARTQTGGSTPEG